ncbi:phosphosulfolactate synthase [Desulfonispora thiosulfatigenes DSM 11270]|uniref:Phosphosulfolactate synthase n=1 Tax=Desulfonispora thiosulfatigenes DSM 11270 TaxID=656914 RepID=A0A1W1VT54_DESTI|nr:phosphosulfolactate synthase [Desulfonispora thiosulfatigenes]SMB96547.1 phosphosulfolactate synthase [Desulfonispora thiosulfatigenes DSM 11270]
MFEKGAWSDIISLPLGNRANKPRNKGLTMVIDKGLGLKDTKDLLEVSSEYIDFLKLGFGTAAFYSKKVLEKKIDLAHKFDVAVYPGGTFLEVAFYQGKIKSFLDRSKKLGFEYVEVSDGTITLKPEERKGIIQMALDRDLKVITEVGKKDVNQQMSIYGLFSQVRKDLEWGAYKVIVEGRENGKGVSLYDNEGNIVINDLEELMSNVDNLDDIIWEAPLKEQQTEFITRIGSNVNIGNIPTSEVLSLEALRTGLRGDTLEFYLSSKGMKRLHRST